ncbi:serine/threonine-protein kinase [Massilibacteroides sp.]|uniref:serine/threonine-protein kinase n=1 Tax=Massilibacteroides sp. TaxID=2034766 RepID=UPI002625D5A6|nr:serine/threonine-protein kinase [Massilibacteroides sp.]MDD4515075.1 serine/threonine-protein kinase [Massilibacteroides sp.]
MNLPNGYILQKGKYKLKHVVGQGGFGITYNGVWFTEVKGPLGALETEVPVCIKEYFFKDYCFREIGTNIVKVHSETGKILFEKFKEKLIKEAKILSDVSHPNVVKVLEVFEENETAYIVMEYITGCSLKYMLDKNGVLPENKVLKYIHQIGEALEFVHKKSILHLDIKPSNILIDKDDNARLIDFGVSKRYDIESQETSTTMLTLSKGFASIEQYDDEGMQTFSPCPDIYSLGATMYNLLTGKIPTESILRATRSLIKPVEINPSIASKTEAVILKAMEIMPENRFQSAKEMISSLDTPPQEKETKNTLQEIHQVGGDETELLSDNADQIIDKALSLKKKKNKTEKNKKRILVSVFITVFLLVVSAAVFFLQKNVAQNNIANVPKVIDIPKEETEEIKSDIIPEETIQETVQEEKTTTPLEPVASEEIPSPSSSQSVEKKEEPKPEPQTVHEKPLSTSLAESEEKFIQFMTDGKQKMDIFDFSGAKAALTQAKTLKPGNSEVQRLLASCEEKEAEQQTAKRMSLYEEKMSFGFYKIVRKKETGRYGAIDNKGIEKIPCIYIGVGVAENGRAFEREDHLFDIYNADGEVLGEGLTYY